MTDTSTRPPATLLDEPLPEELRPAPAAPAAPVEQTFALVPIDAIVPGPHNPRRELGDLEGLAASIRAVGILEPLIVEWASPSSPYMLLAGHRRHAAAKLAGLPEVPCLIRQTEASPALRLEMAIVENLQREGLAPLDEADGYRELVKLGLSQRAIAERVGCSQSHVSKRLGLLDLPAPVQKRVEKGTMPLEAAAALTRLKDHPEKLKAAADEDPSRILQAVERAEQDIAWEAKVAELREIAKGKKWKVVDEPRDRWASRKFKTLAKWDHQDRELDLDVRKHQAEPCHAVMIPVRRNFYNDKPSATSVCTDPARHGPKGASTLKVKVTPKPKRELAEWEIKQRDDKKAHEQAAAARAAVISRAVAEYKPALRRSAELQIMLRSLIDAGGYDNRKERACAYLGLETAGGSQAQGAALHAYADGSQERLHRAALAVALAAVEARLLSHRFDVGGVVDHFAYLATLGYEQSPWETARLAEATGENSDG